MGFEDPLHFLRAYLFKRGQVEHVLTMTNLKQKPLLFTSLMNTWRFSKWSVWLPRWSDTHHAHIKEVWIPVKNDFFWMILSNWLDHCVWENGNFLKIRTKYTYLLISFRIHNGNLQHGLIPVGNRWKTDEYPFHHSTNEADVFCGFVGKTHLIL